MGLPTSNLRASYEQFHTTVTKPPYPHLTRDLKYLLRYLPEGTYIPTWEGTAKVLPRCSRWAWGDPYYLDHLRAIDFISANLNLVATTHT